MSKPCDNKSVGILVRNHGKLLLIERKQYNFGFAIPAGHCDSDNPLTAAKKELSEEVGLTTHALEERLRMRLQNPCLKRGGLHHEWFIFEAVDWNGELLPSQEETKSFLWADRAAIAALAEKLREFAAQHEIPLDTECLPQLVTVTNEDPAWQKQPGLEPPMYFLFQKLGIL